MKDALFEQVKALDTSIASDPAQASQQGGSAVLAGLDQLISAIDRFTVFPMAPWTTGNNVRGTCPLL